MGDQKKHLPSLVSEKNQPTWNVLSDLLSSLSIVYLEKKLPKKLQTPQGMPSRHPHPPDAVRFGPNPGGAPLPPFERKKRLWLVTSRWQDFKKFPMGLWKRIPHIITGTIVYIMYTWMVDFQWFLWCLHGATVNYTEASRRMYIIS